MEINISFIFKITYLNSIANNDIKNLNTKLSNRFV